jgi:hypothetical protein
MPSELEQRIRDVSAERSVVTLTLDPVVLVDPFPPCRIVHAPPRRCCEERNRVAD